jgi:hypothetical protein
VSSKALEFLKHVPTSGVSSITSSKSNPFVILPPISSTPCPLQVISGSVSPTWDPSSCTPVPPETPWGVSSGWGSPVYPLWPLAAMGHSEQCWREKPFGRLNRKNGYKLEDALGLSSSDVSEIKVESKNYHWWVY